MDHHHQHGPTADVSVRPGLEQDARAIAAIQVAAWRADFAGTWPEQALASLDLSAIEAVWRQALTDPPTSDHRLLTACAGPVVVGFAAVAPAGDGVAELVALEVSPARRGAGHGSRLLAACADTLRDRGHGAVRAWVTQRDEDRERFLRAAGLAPSGLVRTVDVHGTEVTEEAWQAAL